MPAVVPALPETAHLQLRPITEADFELYFLLNTEPEMMRTIGPPRSAEQVREWLRQIPQDYSRHPGLGRWFTVEKASGAVVGLHMLKPLADSGHVELAYRLLPAFWGKGYATEMGRALVQYGFEALHLPQIVGITSEDNLASQQVLEKCGLRYQHMAHYYDHDVRFYALDNPATS